MTPGSLLTFRNPSSVCPGPSVSLPTDSTVEVDTGTIIRRPVQLFFQWLEPVVGPPVVVVVIRLLCLCLILVKVLVVDRNPETEYWPKYKRTWRRPRLDPPLSFTLDWLCPTGLSHPVGSPTERQEFKTYPRLPVRLGSVIVPLN